MRNEQHTPFHKKVTSIRKGKNWAFSAFTHTRLFSIVSNFFLWNFLAILKKSFALKNFCINVS